jgi:hypothetical protein
MQLKLKSLKNEVVLNQCHCISDQDSPMFFLFGIKTDARQSGIEFGNFDNIKVTIEEIDNVCAENQLLEKKSDRPDTLWGFPIIYDDMLPNNVIEIRALSAERKIENLPYRLMLCSDYFGIEYTEVFTDKKSMLSKILELINNCETYVTENNLTGYKLCIDIGQYDD